MPESRQLAVIMFTDIVGYTAMMGDDEERALDVLRRNRAIHSDAVSVFAGKLLKEMGDGMLASFGSASHAVACASAIQRSARSENIELRIGLHQGEVVLDGNDIFGDGVNVASRIEQLAKPGTVAVSESVYREIHNKPFIQSTLLGEFELKNVEAAWKIYEVQADLEQVDHLKSSQTKLSFRSLWQLKVPQVIAVSIAAMWVISKFLGPVFERAQWSPYWLDALWILVVGLLPTVGWILYHKLRLRQAGWERRDRRVAVINIILVLGVLTPVLISKDMGSTTQVASYLDSNQEAQVETVIKPQYLRKVAIFPFDQEQVDSASLWIGHGIAEGLNLDLDQDKHIMAWSAGREGSFQRKIDRARNAGNEWFLTGTYQAGDTTKIDYALYKSRNGKKVAGAHISTTDLLGSLDEITQNVKQWMGLTEKQIEMSTDLQLSQFGSNNLEAVRHLILALPGSSALFHYDRALELDSAFTIAAYNKARFLHRQQLGHLEARQAIELAMRHREKLPLDWELAVRAAYFTIMDRPKEAIDVLQWQMDLDPGNLDLMNTLFNLLLATGEVDALPELAQEMYRLDPTSGRSVEIARAHLIAGELDKATKNINRHVKRHATDIMGLHCQGECAIHRNALDEARESYQAIALHVPEAGKYVEPIEDALRFMSENTLDSAYLARFAGTYRHHDREMQIYCEQMGGQ